MRHGTMSIIEALADAAWVELTHFSVYEEGAIRDSIDPDAVFKHF